MRRVGRYDGVYGGTLGPGDRLAALDATRVGTLTEVVKVAKNPVCGMDVDERKASSTSQYKGQTYYFCSKGCKAAFDKDSEKFVSEKKS